MTTLRPEAETGRQLGVWARLWHEVILRSGQLAAASRLAGKAIAKAVHEARRTVRGTWARGQAFLVGSRSPRRAGPPEPDASLARTRCNEWSKSSPGRRRATLAQVLTEEVRRHQDSGAQTQVVAGNCNLLVRSKHLGLFGSITLSSNLVLCCKLRSMKAVPPTLYDGVMQLFASENRRHPANRWRIITETGEIRLAGEVQLQADPHRARRRMRRCLFRRMEVMNLRFLRLSVRGKCAHSGRGQDISQIPTARGNPHEVTDDHEWCKQVPAARVAG